MQKSFILIIFSILFHVAYSQNAADFDSSFGEGGYTLSQAGTANAEAYGMAIQPDGKVLVSGHVRHNNLNVFGMLRYNTNGTIDTSFGDNGLAATPIAQGGFSKDVLLLDDGKIIQAGHVFSGGSYHAAVVCYLPSGELDTSFGTNGIAHANPMNNCESVDIQSNGKIILGGFINDNFGLCRMNADGSVDTGFGTNGYVMTLINDLYGVASISYISEILIQADDKIIATGFLYSSNSYNDIVIARYQANGALDTGFGTQGIVVSNPSGSSDFGTSLALQPDGKIIVGAHQEESLIPGVPEYDATIIRLNIDGSFDSSFGDNGFVKVDVNEEAGYVSSVAVQENGKIVFVGAHVLYSSSKFDMYFGRLNSDGSLDDSFGEGGIRHYAISEEEDAPQSVEILPDGKILFSGYAYNSNGNYGFMIGRLLGDSSADLPEVAVSFDNITHNELDVSFVPNDACASYYFVIMTEEEMEMWGAMMGSPEAAIKAFGIQKTEAYTHHYEELIPDTEYYVYTISVGHDGFEAPYLAAYVKTLPMGGSGEASATIELLDITETSLRMIVTPNSETAVYHDGLITKDYFDEIGEEAAVELIRDNGYPLYGPDDWVWQDLDPSTDYVALASCKNILGEWGPTTIVEFATLGGTSLDETAAMEVEIFPNPTRGQLNMRLDGTYEVTITTISGAQLLSKTVRGEGQFDLSGLEAGIYVITAKSNAKKIQRTFIVN